jgi:hypothetical protein
MLAKLKTFPPVLLVLFTLVLLMEIMSFLLLGQLTTIARSLLLMLMLLTIRGNRPARYILLLLLFAGAVVLSVTGVSANASVGLALAYFYVPATILTATALTLVLLRRTLNVAGDDKAPSAGADGT